MPAMRTRRDIAESSTPANACRSTMASGCSSAPTCSPLGWLANREREKRHGGRTYYNFNIRLEATNVCVASCLFCSFARLRPGDAGSYTMSLEADLGQAARARPSAAHRNPRRQRPASRSAVRLLPGACCAASNAFGRASI